MTKTRFDLSRIYLYLIFFSNALMLTKCVSFWKPLLSFGVWQSWNLHPKEVFNFKDLLDWYLEKIEELF